jgi:hypothetical protein
MFNNIGGKIKTLAKVIAWIGIIISIIAGVAGCVQAQDNVLASAGTQVLISICIIIVGSLLSWISSWTLYGFGELIEKTTEIARNTAATSVQKEKISSEIVCDEQKSEDGVLESPLSSFLETILTACENHDNVAANNAIDKLRSLNPDNKISDMLSEIGVRFFLSDFEGAAEITREAIAVTLVHKYSNSSKIESDEPKSENGVQSGA